MATNTLTDLLSSLRARAVDGASVVYHTALMRLPERTLLVLERLGLPGVGWALCALALCGANKR